MRMTVALVAARPVAGILVNLTNDSASATANETTLGDCSEVAWRWIWEKLAMVYEEPSATPAANSDVFDLWWKATEIELYSRSARRYAEGGDLVTKLSENLEKRLSDIVAGKAAVAGLTLRSSTSTPVTGSGAFISNERVFTSSNYRGV